MRASLRFEILRRDEFTCVYCGRSAPDVILHVDHIIPLSEDSGVWANSVANLAAACIDCNLGKRDGDVVWKARINVAEKIAAENRRLLQRWRRSNRDYLAAIYDAGFDRLADRMPPIADIGQEKWFQHLNWWMTPLNGARLIVDPELEESQEVRPS